MVHFSHTYPGGVADPVNCVVSLWQAIEMANDMDFLVGSVDEHARDKQLFIRHVIKQISTFNGVLTVYMDLRTK